MRLDTAEAECFPVWEICRAHVTASGLQREQTRGGRREGRRTPRLGMKSSRKRPFGHWETRVGTVNRLVRKIADRAVMQRKEKE